jgi:hypothetical protein
LQRPQNVIMCFTKTAFLLGCRRTMSAVHFVE